MNMREKSGSGFLTIGEADELLLSAGVPVFPQDVPELFAAEVSPHAAAGHASMRFFVQWNGFRDAYESSPAGQVEILRLEDAPIALVQGFASHNSSLVAERALRQGVHEPTVKQHFVACKLSGSGCSGPPALRCD